MLINIMLGCVTIIVLTILCTSAVEFTRILWRVIRQRQLGNSVATAVEQSIPEFQDAAMTLHSLVVAIAKIQETKRELMTLVYETCPPNYPELNLLANTLKSVQRSQNAMTNLIQNLRAATEASATITDPTTQSAETAEQTGVGTERVPHTTSTGTAA
jgi:hypothetical protein